MVLWCFFTVREISFLCFWHFRFTPPVAKEMSKTQKKHHKTIKNQAKKIICVLVCFFCVVVFMFPTLYCNFCLSVSNLKRSRHCAGKVCDNYFQQRHEINPHIKPSSLIFKYSLNWLKINHIIAGIYFFSYINRPCILKKMLFEHKCWINNKWRYTLWK